jgi:hypothetical protein
MWITLGGPAVLSISVHSGVMVVLVCLQGVMVILKEINAHQ